jgi:hypothetical protein
VDDAAAGRGYVSARDEPGPGLDRGLDGRRPTPVGFWAPCGVCIVRVEPQQDGGALVTATWTHDIESWPTSAVQRKLRPEQVCEVVDQFLAVYVN